MASHSRSGTVVSTNGNGGVEASYFEVQRGELVREIALSLEQVLQNLNRLNRGLEGVIAVGNEFSSVEALWSQFENVMGKGAEGEGTEEKDAAEGEGRDAEAVGRGEEENGERDDTVVR